MDFIDLKTPYALQRDAIDARMRAVLEHGQYILGPEVRELEHKLVAYTGAAECVTCASGTEALLIALMALGVGPGDEVITTPFTFVATAETIVLAGATPVFVDIEPDTYNLDAARLEAAITPRTRAIMPVSLYGQPPDMDEINEIAARHGLAVIEDAAQSFGAEYHGRRSGNLSTIGCTSFFPSKPLGCFGDGGAAFTSDPALAQAMREIRVHGQSKRYVHTRVGVGGRMDTLQCAVVLAKLERFDWEVAERARIAARYVERLRAAGVTTGLPTIRDGRTSVWAQFTLSVATREPLQQALQAAGIPTAVHYPVPLHAQPAYARFAPAIPLPNAERAAREVVSLPMSAYLRDDDQQRVVATVAAALALEPHAAT